MTNEEAIEYGKEQLAVFGGEHAEFIKVAIAALEKQEKYRWHNLIDPNDLPVKYLSLEVSVDVVVYDITGCYHNAFYSYYHGWWANSPNKIIAWKYIEPYEIGGKYYGY